jgi:hypothetical protein
MQASGHNPAEHLWVQAIDVDRLAGLMCYVQLSLWHVPAEVIVGNTLSLKVREVWHTPAHILGSWSYKLRVQAEAQISDPRAKREPEPSMASDNSPNEPPVADDPKKPSGTSVQFDFGF